MPSLQVSGMRLGDGKLTTRKCGTCWPPGPLLTPPGTDLTLHLHTFHQHLSPNHILVRSD